MKCYSDCKPTVWQQLLLPECLMREANNRVLLHVSRLLTADWLLCFPAHDSNTHGSLLDSYYVHPSIDKHSSGFHTCLNTHTHIYVCSHTYVYTYTDIDEEIL